MNMDAEENPIEFYKNLLERSLKEENNKKSILTINVPLYATIANQDLIKFTLGRKFMGNHFSQNESILEATYKFP